jgi:hypothetical protein
MSPTTIGCDIEHKNQADGVIRRVQIHGAPIDVAAMTKAKDRSTQPRMSEGAVFFAMFEDDTSLAYRRPNTVADIFVASESDEGAQDLNTSMMPLRVAVYQEGTSPDFNSEFFIDNVSLRVSTILWEFSVDNGETWRPIISVINMVNGRFMLGCSTTDILVRVTGTNNDDWVAGYVLRPVFNVISERHM